LVPPDPSRREGRYWNGTCNDGIDNDCDGETDLDIECNAGTDLCAAGVNGKWCSVGPSSGNPNTLYSVWGVSMTRVWAVGANGTILHSGGGSWSTYPIGVTTNLTFYGISGSGTNRICIVGPGNIVLNEFGQYSKIDIGSEFYDVHVAMADDAMVVGQTDTPGSVCDINMATATPAESCEKIAGAVLRGVWGLSNANFWVVGDGGKIYHKDTSGWTEENVPPNRQNKLRDIYGSSCSSTSIWTVGDKGTILNLNQASGSGVWSDVSPSEKTDNDLHGVYACSCSDVFAVGKNGTILHSVTGGWEIQDTPTKDTLNAVWGCSSTGAYAVGENGVILKYTP
jgi:hypothetical protein